MTDSLLPDVITGPSPIPRLLGRIADLGSTVDDLVRSQQVSTPNTQQSWQPVVYENSWQNGNQVTNGSNKAPAHYWKDPSGIVHWEGTIGNPTSMGGSSVVCHLTDSRYQPLYTQSFVVAYQPSAGGNAQFGYITIGNAGTVTAWTNGAPITDLFLDGINYRSR